MKPKKPWYFLLIVIGLCFFFNPYLATVDFLPDFIGALLIFAGLVPISRVFLPLNDAKRAFLTVALADFLKQILLMFVFGMGSTGEQETLLLVVALLSATVGTALSVFAMRHLFEGFDVLAGSFEALPLYGIHKKGRSRTELFGRLTVFFLIFREVLSLLPELTALLNSTYVDNGFIRMYDYIGTMRILVFVPVLALGGYWLFRLFAYFKLFFRESEMISSVEEKTRAYIVSHPGVRVKLRYATAFLLLAVGFFLTADFYLDYQNVFSDTLAGILLLGGLLVFRTPFKKRLGALISGAAFTVLATVSTTLSYRFSTQFLAGNIGRDEAVTRAYQTMWLLSLAEFLAFATFLAFFLLLLRDLYVREGGYIHEGELSEFETRSHTAEKTEFDGKLLKCYLVGFLSGLCSFLFDYLKEWPDTKLFRLLEFFWAVDFLFAIGAAISASLLLSHLFGKIKERYRFE